MELGALVCKPRKPKCESCPLSNKCSGRGNAESFPEKKKNRKKIEYIDALVMVDPSGLPFLTRRDNNGRFGGLWGPPMGNVDTEAKEKSARYHTNCLTENFVYRCGEGPVQRE